MSAALLLSGCGGAQKDGDLCDFYQALGVDYVHTQGYVPSSVQDEMKKYC